MQTEKNKITSSARILSIDIDGIIGEPEELQFGGESRSVATYERFEQALAEIGEDKPDRVVLNIRSTGGNLDDALLIYDAAVGLGVEVVTRCYGYVASAATIIAQAASPGCREISANGFYLIHCCESTVEGNSHSLTLTKQLLDKSDQRLAEIYSEASGRPVEEFRALMNENVGKGRWLTPQEALDAGLVDRIIPAAPITDSVTDRITSLGLPPLPAEQQRKGGWWSTLMEKVGLRSSKAVRAEQEHSVEPSVADSTHTTHRPTVPPSRLHTAEPTRTKECEDPAVRENTSTATNSNQSAYEADARSLREVATKNI